MFKKFDGRRPKISLEGENSLPSFLSPQATPAYFSDMDKTYERSGSAARVKSFDCPVEVPGTELGFDTQKFVVKKYQGLYSQDKKFIFTRNNQLRNFIYDISILKEKHERTKQFFAELPNLVVPTQFILFGNNTKDACIYAVQRRIDGCIFAGVTILEVSSFISQFSEEQRLQIKASLEKVIDLFSNAIEQSAFSVPDMNYANFGIDKDGHLCLIDTDKIVDWLINPISESAEYQKAFLKFAEDQKRKLEVLKKILRECF